MTEETGDAGYRVGLFGSLDWEAPLPGLRSKTAILAGKKLRLVEFCAEFEEPTWCTRGHWGYVLSGAIEVDIAGAVHRFGAGDIVAIPPGETTRHRHHGTLETAVLFLVEDID